MLPAASTMEKRTPSCWSPGEWIRMATPCRMHGSWTSNLESGERWEGISGSTAWVSSMQATDGWRSLIVSVTYVDSITVQVITKPGICTTFQQLWLHDTIFSLSLAHPSWSCTITAKAHCYSLKFGTRVDRSHHVWGMPKVEVGKVKWCSTETSPNCCDGVQWAKQFAFFSPFQLVF